jgi:predicted nucleic acid-binding protein
MKAVSDASPIIFLSKLQRIDLLPECFEKVWIPAAVEQELAGLAPVPGISMLPVSAAGRQFVEGALGRLHRGELESMVLAREVQADYVLLDDLLARRRAQRLGLKTMGTVGVIVLAYRQGRIASKTAIDWVDELMRRHGLYLSTDIASRVKASLAE